MRTLFIFLLFIFFHTAEGKPREAGCNSMHHQFDQQSDGTLDFMLCDDTSDDDYEFVKKYPAQESFVQQPLLIQRKECAYEFAHKRAHTTRSVLTRICVLRL